MKRPERYGSPDPEKNDPTPVEMPLGYMKPTPLQDLIASMVRNAVSQEQNDDFETEEEANDFTEENPELLDMSPYTLEPVNEEAPLAPPETRSVAPQEPITATPTPTATPPTGDPPEPPAEEPS